MCLCNELPGGAFGPHTAPPELSMLFLKQQILLLVYVIFQQCDAIVISAKLHHSSYVHVQSWFWIPDAEHS